MAAGSIRDEVPVSAMRCREEVPAKTCPQSSRALRRALDGASLAPSGASPWLFSWWPLFVGASGLQGSLPVPVRSWPWPCRWPCRWPCPSRSSCPSRFPLPALFLARSWMLSQSLSAGPGSAGAGCMPLAGGLILEEYLRVRMAAPVARLCRRPRGWRVRNRQATEAGTNARERELLCGTLVHWRGDCP